MKRVKFIAVLIALLACIMPSVSMNKAYAADSKHKAVFLFETTQNEKEVTIEVRLEQNDGISALNMELSYNTTAMTLTNVVKGQNFDSIVYTNQPEGFAAVPFKFNWMSLYKINDDSTGTFLTLTFKTRDDAPNGSYNIGFKDVDADYYEQGNQDPLSVTTIVDTARVIISKNGIEAKTVEPGDTDESGGSVGLVVGLIVGGVVLVGGVIVLITKMLKHKKGWQKLDD